MQYCDLTCPAGVRVLDHLTRRGVEIPAFCGGSGVCGRCRIRVVQGTLPVTPSDRSFLTAEALRDGWRLACCAVTTEPVRIEVPVEKEDISQAPAHVQDAHRLARAQHRYRIAVSGHSAALVDLTAVTVVELVRDAVHPEQLLLEKYPDVQGGLEQTVTAEPVPDAEAAIEQVIMDWFHKRR